MTDLDKVKQNGLSLKFIQYQTEEMCLIAVKQRGYVLQHVHHQTEEICLEAVKRYGFALQYVQQQTEAICLAAVQWHWRALQYVQPHYFKEIVKKLRLRTLFNPELDEYIKECEKKMQS